MAARRNTKSTESPVVETPEQIGSAMVALLDTITNAENAGKSAVKAATLESFHANADAYSALGQYVTDHVAPHMTNAVNGENVKAMFAKDAPLYVADSEMRGTLTKSANAYAKGLRVFRFDTPEMRVLFVNGPATLLPRCKALQGVTGHNPTVTGYVDFLGALNATEIAKVKALPADFLAKFDHYRDDTTGETIYVKRKPVVADSETKIPRNDVTKVYALDRDALTALVAESRFDVQVSDENLADFAKYVAARYALSLKRETDATPAAPAKVTITV